MEVLKDKEIKTLRTLFIDKNNLVLILSGVPMIFSIILQPPIVSSFKVLLTLVASITYAISTYLFINNKKDVTILTWVVSAPLVVYCSAGSVNNLDLPDLEKGINWVAYLSAYFFFIALAFRILELYRIRSEAGHHVE